MLLLFLGERRAGGEQIADLAGGIGHGFLIRSASSPFVGPASRAIVRYLLNGLAMISACLWAAYCSGDIAAKRSASSGLPIRCRNATAFQRFDSASLRDITLAISLSRVGRPCSCQLRIVVNAELGAGVKRQDCGPRFQFRVWVAAPDSFHRDCAEME